MSLERRATTGAAPVPVPPPMPAVMNTCGGGRRGVGVGWARDGGTGHGRTDIRGWGAVGLRPRAVQLCPGPPGVIPIERGTASSCGQRCCSGLGTSVPGGRCPTLCASGHMRGWAAQAGRGPGAHHVGARHRRRNLLVALLCCLLAELWLAARACRGRARKGGHELPCLGHDAGPGRVTWRPSQAPLEPGRAAAGFGPARGSLASRAGRPRGWRARVLVRPPGCGPETEGTHPGRASAASRSAACSSPGGSPAPARQC